MPGAVNAEAARQAKARTRPAAADQSCAAAREQRQSTEAEQLYLAVLAVDPKNSVALYRRAILCAERGENAEALRLIEAAMKANPVAAEAVSDYSLILDRLGRTAEAVAAFDLALVLRPKDWKALYNRGVCLGKLGRSAQAAASYQRSLDFNPQNLDALINHGVALSELGRHEEAAASFARATRIKPDYAEAHFKEAVARLTLGDFRTGWEKYGWRWRTTHADGARAFHPQPHWDGQEPLAGKAIYVYSEQGLGDALMFVRYTPLVAAQAAAVIVGVQPPLKALVAGMEGISVVTTGEPLPAFDLQCAMLSLPRCFKTDIATIPARVPYIHAPADRIALWRHRLPHDGCLRIGLVWAGSRTFARDKRSASVDQFDSLVGCPGTHFVRSSARAARARRRLSALSSAGATFWRGAARSR
jgi:Flp pilus assembly protein TadD